jgi:helicase
MKPLLSLKKDDFDEINEFLIQEGENLIQKPPNPWDLEYDDYLRSIKTALMFKDWIEEVGEDKLLEKFGITPGELRIRLETADWLLYATHELALLLVMKDFLKDIRKIRIRVKYGIKEELLPLIQLKGVGRVRSRILYNSNIKSLSDLRKIPIESLSRIIGPKIAMDIKNQLNQIDKNDTQKILEFYE